MMNIGGLRHRVLVENPTRTPDGDGGFTIAWASANPSEVWAKIEMASPMVTERRVGNTVTAPISHVVTVRYHSEISTLTRLTFEDTRQFFVRGVHNVNEVDETMMLACEEIV